MDQKCATHNLTHYSEAANTPFNLFVTAGNNQGPVPLFLRTTAPKKPSSLRHIPWLDRSPRLRYVCGTSITVTSAVFAFQIRKDYQPCINCRHGCMDNGCPHPAIGFMDRLPWEFLEKILSPDMTWEQAADYARRSGNFVVTWYSEEAPPCVFRYLEGILNAIVVVAFTRGEISGRGEVAPWFEKAKAVVLAADVKATSIVPAMFRPEPAAILDCALCYWVQAAIAYDGLAPDTCAGSMMQCNFYLGMAAGPKLAAEMNRAIGSQRTAHLEEFAMELRRLLEELALRLNGRMLPNVRTVLDEIRVPMVEFHKKQIAELQAKDVEAKPVEVTDIDRYITKICRPSHAYFAVVGPAFEKVCERRKGPTPKPRTRSRK